MKALLVGSGNRGTAYATYLKEGIHAVCDRDIEKARRLIGEFGLVNASAYDDYRKCTGFDSIIIAVPDHMHEEVFLWALKSGKPILLEKPVAVNNGSLRKMHEAGADYKSAIILGFGLRYTFMYRKVLGLLSEGAIGDVVAIEASETLGRLHAAKFFRRWHRFSEFSGGLMNTKCSHDMDILNLAAASRMRYVSSFGSNTVFSKGFGNDVCNETCKEYETCPYADDSEGYYSTADLTVCPYRAESDIVDHQSVLIEFENGITAVFTLTMHSGKGDRIIRVHGSKGMISARFEDQKVMLTMNHPFHEQTFGPGETWGSHGGGDRLLCGHFVDAVLNNTCENQLADGILASAAALAADESRLYGRIVDMRDFVCYMGL
ncbi:MAG: Gfo/Idh/MocA family oxidoreductase [Clostridia bacterium]|nr:Gfo/Idh/MocA family oxidoreductase [Clostridia bacterium]